MGLLMVPGMLLLAASPFWVPALRWWKTARALDVPSPFLRTMRMRLIRVPPGRVYLPLRRAREAGVALDAATAEAHLLAGGNLERVVEALVLAAEQKLSVSFQDASALDLARKDPLQIVRSGLLTPEGRIDYRAVFPHWK
jgi:uncharacterized protein YqfA (UPF0365 family)